MTLALASRFRGPAQPDGHGGVLVYCPAHADGQTRGRQSLHLSPTADGRVLVHCFAGCSTQAVLAAAGLTAQDLRPSSSAPDRGRPTIVAVYDYRDEAGVLLYQVVRYQPKDFRQRRPDPTRPGHYLWTLGSVRRVLYRLPELHRQRRVTIVEGEQDADTLWQHGIPATTNAGGASKWGRHATEYLDQLARQGVLDLVVLEDHDPPGRAHARQVIRAALAYGGFDVRHVPLPGLADKEDVTDWLARGHSVDELHRLIEAAPHLTEPPPELLPSPASPSQSAPGAVIPINGHYAIKDGRICRIRATPENAPAYEELCQFSARIEESRVLDDGNEEGRWQRQYRLVGRLASGEPLRPVVVSDEDFEGMRWVRREWGHRASMRASVATRPMIREAIERWSVDAPERHVYTHTGWRQLADGPWVYLTASGAVGRDDIEVDLGPFWRYTLPRRPVGVRAALQASLRLLDLAPWPLTLPLWASVWRAILGVVLPCDYTLWVEGQSQRRKSSLVALYLSHWGRFERTTLPGSWTSTANALEMSCFRLAHTWCVIDDYAPSSATDARELEGKAIRLVRAQGNMAGRSRLRADLTPVAERPPRGLLVATGESHPGGLSLVGRMMLLEADRYPIDLARLTQSQAEIGLLPHATAGFVEWLTPQMGALADRISRSWMDHRQRCQRAGGFGRIPEILAHLWVGLDAGLAYAVDCGALTEAQVEAIRQRAEETLLAVATAQDAQVEAERPTRRFIRVLQTLIYSRRIGFLARHQRPEDTRPPPDPVGWVLPDEGLLALAESGEAAYQAVTRFLRETPEPFVLRLQRLQQEFLADGLSVGADRRATVVKRLGGRPRRVLALQLAAIERLMGQAFALPTELGEAASEDDAGASALPLPPGDAAPF